MGRVDVCLGSSVMKSWAVPATAIATLSLIFVLFLDAVQLRLDERANWKLPLLVLGPGTGLTIAIIALAAWILLSATLVQALLLGAILSSTDPVVLRDVIRDQRIPRSIRHTLGIEAGTNDLVVLPIVLILIAVAHGQLGGAGEWFTFGAQLFVLGPVAGFAVGAIGAWVLDKVDAWLGVNRTYQALYGLAGQCQSGCARLSRLVWAARTQFVVVGLARGA
jgi:NhaP-type Na+/H+ or K+/H+ antiporter